jgi:hypothetical protein
MNLNDDVVYRCRRLGPLHQRHPGRSRSLVRYHDCFHGNRLLDAADVFQRVVLEGDELGRAEVERLLTVGGASGDDDVGAELTCSCVLSSKRNQRTRWLANAQASAAGCGLRAAVPARP